MPSPLASPSRAGLIRWAHEVLPLVGTPAAVAAACVYGLPRHVAVAAFLMALASGLGVTIGFHRLFTHRAFATVRPVEWVLMVLGCTAGQAAPFWWVATHRDHHRHSDRPGDPHSPHLHADNWRGFWHAHMGWLHEQYVYDPRTVPDLTRRRDLAFIDRHWLEWYLLGLALPAAVAYLIGGTATDALLGFLWGGLVRHFVTQQATFAVNSVAHVWGSRPYPTTDSSRNNWLVGVLAMGEGWHNNHHAFPTSARHGFRWWQADVSWYTIWALERVGLAWRVKRPIAAHPPQRVGIQPSELPQEAQVVLPK
ncbi:MAG: acyl-CoA desaturase [Gemmataceae bacterium]